MFAPETAKQVITVVSVKPLVHFVQFPPLFEE
jgi:hypothetical protein